MKTGLVRKVNRIALAQRQTKKKMVMIINILYVIAMILVSFGRTTGITVGLFFGMGGLFCGYIVALNLFKDLNNKQISDVELSMPVTGAERFWSRILAFVYIQVIPLFISAFISMHVLFLRHISELRKYTAWENFKTYGKFWTIILCLIAAAMFMVMIVAFCSSCTGTYAGATFFSIAVAILQAVLPYAFCAQVFENTSGIEWTQSHTMIFNFWGPGILRAMETYHFTYLLAGVLLNLCLSMILLWVTEKIYEKRDAKFVGTTVSNKVFFHIVVVMGICMIYLALFFSSSFLWGILIAGVCYLIINIVVSRKQLNIRIFVKWIIRFAVLTIVFIGFMYASVVTGGFGYIHTQPKSNLENTDCNIRIEYEDFENGSNISKTVFFTGEKLTDAQQREILDIYQKQLSTGKQGIKRLFTDPYDWGQDEYRNCGLTITKDNVSQKEIKNGGAGEIYNKSYNGKKSSWCMRFLQELPIKRDNAKQLENELSRLSYLKKETEN